MAFRGKNRALSTPRPGCRARRIAQLAPFYKGAASSAEALGDRQRHWVAAPRVRRPLTLDHKTQTTCFVAGSGGR